MSRVYWAGFFDGEGSIGVYKHRNNHIRLTVQIANTDLSVLETLKEEFGGSIISRKPQPGCKPLYNWVIVSRMASIFLKTLYPYLRIKSEEAALALEAANILHRRLHTTNNSRIKHPYPPRLFEIIVELKRLKNVARIAS